MLPTVRPHSHTHPCTKASPVLKAMSSVLSVPKVLGVPTAQPEHGRHSSMTRFQKKENLAYTESGMRFNWGKNPKAGFPGKEGRIVVVFADSPSLSPASSRLTRMGTSPFSQMWELGLRLLALSLIQPERTPQDLKAVSPRLHLKLLLFGLLISRTNFPNNCSSSTTDSNSVRMKIPKSKLYCQWTCAFLWSLFLNQGCMSNIMV